MREFYENHKGLFFGSIAGVCLLVGVAILGIVFLMGDGQENTKKARQPNAVQAASNVNKVQEPEPDDEEEEVVTHEAIEPVEEAVSDDALEIVEDSVLDVVETPNPSTTPVPEENSSQTTTATTDTNNTTPSTDLSEMAQNVPFPYEIHVNKQMNCVTIYAMDKYGAYSIPYKAMVCSTGKATPLGTYRTPAKYRWKVLMGNVWGQYSTRVTGGILFHSVQYSKNSNDTLNSSAYNKLGTTASHGCIRLTTIDAKWIYDNCPLGTTVVVYNDSNPGPLGKPTAMKVPANNKWDPTDPDPANPWRGRILRIDGVQNLQMERGYPIDLMAGVVAWDSSDNNVTGNIQISTNADFNTVGSYAIHYQVTDAYGNQATADAMLTVVDTQPPVFLGIPARIEGKRPGEITRDLLMSGVSVVDNNIGFPAEWVEVRIPALVNGDNQIIYVATDANGNQAVASTTVYCDLVAPVIAKKNGINDYIALTQSIEDANLILGRIQVQDASSVQTTYTWTAQDWGYRIDYTAVDSYGNVSNFTDYVKYVDYVFTGTSTGFTVKDIENEEELKKELRLKDSLGNVVELSNAAGTLTISKTKKNDTGTLYEISYTYTYTSPLGTSHTARFTRTATVLGIE